MTAGTRIGRAGCLRRHGTITGKYALTALRTGPTEAKSRRHAEAEPGTHPPGMLKIIPICGRRHGQESRAKFRVGQVANRHLASSRLGGRHRHAR